MKKKKVNRRPSQASLNGIHPPDKNGSDTALLKEKVPQIHVIRLSEPCLPECDGHSGSVAVVDHRCLQTLRELCSKNIQVSPGQKVSFIGSIEPISVLSIGVLAAHFFENLKQTSAVSMYRQLCVNAGSGYPAVEYFSEQLKNEIRNTDHVILLLGVNAFYGMLDVLHHEYCNGEEEIKGKKKTALTQRHQFPREEKETAIMVTFYPTKKKYTVKAKTLPT